MSKYKIEYDSNNSGGRLWLTEENWESLKQAGWEVSKHTALIKVKSEKDPVEVFRNVLKTFEKLTGEHVTDNGCSCCGPPHHFTLYQIIDDEEKYLFSTSGSGLMKYLYDKVPGSFREAVELLNKEKNER